MIAKSGVVKDYMTGKLVTFSPDTDVLDAVHVLQLDDVFSSRDNTQPGIVTG